MNITTGILANIKDGLRAHMVLAAEEGNVLAFCADGWEEFYPLFQSLCTVSQFVQMHSELVDELGGEFSDMYL